MVAERFECVIKDNSTFKAGLIIEGKLVYVCDHFHESSLETFECASNIKNNASSISNEQLVEAV